MKLTINNNLKTRIYLSFIILLFSSNVITEVFAANSSTLYQAAAQKFHVLYQPTKFRKYENNWISTIHLFEKIYKQYPRSIEASKSLYNIATLYRSLYKWNHKLSNIDKSTYYFKKLYDEYPQNYLADDAIYQVGQNFEIYAKDKKLAYLSYQKLLDHFPNSSFADNARKRVTTLGKPHQDFTLRKTVYASYAPKKNSVRSSIKLIPISQVSHWSTSEWTRVVINTPQKVLYKHKLLNTPKNLKKKRIYVDIQNSYIPKDFKKKIIANDGIIKQLRIAQFNKNTSRIVIDLQNYREMKVFDTAVGGEFKIIFDIQGENSTFAIDDFVTTTNKTIQEKKTTTPQQNISLSRVLGLKIKNIVIDPGHGGRDPGALGHGKLYEKERNLQLAIKLRQYLKKKFPNINIYLTRQKDVYLTLDGRSSFARKKKADLFISVHFNAHNNKKTNGIETYFLSLTTDKDSLSLAARENSGTLQSVSDLQDILNDLINNNKVRESKLFAHTVHAQIISHVNGNSKYKMKNLGIKKAPFAVLVGSQVPSILIEGGFLTSSYDANRIKKQEYIDKLAYGISKGIQKYIQTIQKI